MCMILEKLLNKSPKDLLSEYSVDSDLSADIAKLVDAIGISTIAWNFTEIELMAEKIEVLF